MKRLMLILSCLLLSVGMVVAQTKQASGVVLDDTGAEVIGAAIIVKGTSTGTITDADGRFTLNVPAGKEIIVVSYVGMQPQEHKVAQNLRIVLSSATDLDELVVTALGIKRDEKALGYAVTSLKNEDLIKARDANALNSLAGKVAGVSVASTSGSLGGSAKITIRGVNSFGGDTQPLFVIDGVPMDNSSQGSASNNVVDGGVDTGSRAGDINPDDIESMSVLKGAAAAALYGARAKNGVIIITTRKGSKSSKLNVEVNTSLRLDNALRLPDFQNSWAQGNAGVYNTKYLNGWGPKIEGQSVQDYKNQTVSLQAHPDNVKDFYETGETYINSVSLSGGTDKADYRFGFTALNQTGIVPNSFLNRYTFNVNTGYNFSPKVSGRTVVSYYNTKNVGKPRQSSNDPNILASAVNSLPRTFDLASLKNNWIDQYGAQVNIAPDFANDQDQGKNNNPYWITDRNVNSSKLERLIGSQQFTYTPVEWLSFSNNLGVDSYHEDRRDIVTKGTYGVIDGQYVDTKYAYQSINNDFIATFTKNINEDIELKLIGGNNIYQETKTTDQLTVTKLLFENLYTPTNGETNKSTAAYSRKRIVGVYGDLGVSYRNFLFANVTARNDWSSTLPSNNNSYFYPAFSASLIFTELMENKSILDFGKVRLNLANVGGSADPYLTNLVYTAASDYFVQYSINGDFPNSGLLGFSIPRIKPNLDLKPQNQFAFEIGTDLRFLNNRISLDATYYYISTTDQIVNIDVPISTGYFVKAINAGEVRNTGVELALNLVPIKTKDFEWNLGVNFAANTQKVMEIDKNNPELNYSLASGWSGLQFKAEKGKSFGLYGRAWKRNEAGEIIITKAGMRETVNNVRLGDIAPDWTMGISNSFSYKNFALSFLIDIKEGGVLYSGTSASLKSLGLAKETEGYDRVGAVVVDEGVVLQADGSYAKNTTAITAQKYWEQLGNSSNTESNVYDASYIKLRELRLNYQFPTSFVRKLSLTKLELAIEGRNLWIIKDHAPHTDPEATMFGVNSVADAIEFNSVPATRTLGFNIRLGF